MSTMSQAELGEVQEKLEAVQRAARDFLKGEWSARAVRELEDSELGFSAALWKQLRELGWPGMLVPEAQEGQGGSFIEFAGLAEELGRALAASPLLTSAVAAEAVRLAGDADLQQAILPRAATGEVILTLATREPDLTTEPLATKTHAWRTDGGYRLDGFKLFVPYAELADYLVTSARLPDEGDALALFLVDGAAPGVRRTRLKTLDWSPLAEVAYEDVAVGADRLLAQGEAAEKVLREVQLQASLAACAELLGVATTAHEMAVEYAKERVAFGRPIGVFQAVKHRLVDQRVDLEVARTLCQGAAQDLSAQLPEREVSVAMAAFWCLDTLRKVPEGAHQVFGGIGITWDHDIHLFTRRAATLTALLGERAIYREVVAEFLDARE